MSCVNEDFEGNCELYPEIDCMVCNPDGVCVCSDDPDPANSCPNYESTNICRECGVDMDMEECLCESY